MYLKYSIWAGPGAVLGWQGQGRRKAGPKEVGAARPKEFGAGVAGAGPRSLEG